MSRLSLSRIRQEIALRVHELQIFLPRECADRVRMQGMADLSCDRVDGRARPQGLAVTGDLAGERRPGTNNRNDSCTNGSRNQALSHYLFPSAEMRLVDATATS